MKVAAVKQHIAKQQALCALLLVVRQMQGLSETETNDGNASSNWQ